MSNASPAVGFAVHDGFFTVLAAAGFRVLPDVLDLPGLSLAIVAPDHRRGSMVVSSANWDGDDYLHASIAFVDADPTYADLKLLHRAVFGRKRYAYQVFAPEAAHVNLHEHALHLFGRADGRHVLPEFNVFGSL